MQVGSKQQVPPIITARTFSCKRDLLFITWSDPQLLAKWWGPNGFTNTIHEFDFRKNGTWKLTMHGPDGADYYNINRFTEITVPEKIAFVHIEPVHQFMAMAVFEEQENSTRLTYSMIFKELSEYEKVKDFIIAANEENFDRLEKVLQQ